MTSINHEGESKKSDFVIRMRSSAPKEEPRKIHENQDRLDVLYTVRNALVHYWGGRGLVYSVKNRIYLLGDLANPRPILLGAIPWRSSQLLCHARLADRALKGSILQVHEASNQLLLVCNGHSWWSIEPDGTVGDISPFSKTRPMSRAICTSAQGMTFIADYIDNKERTEPIRIYRSKNLSSFEVAWEFPPGEIRHIHALVPDTEDFRRIWILTGDNDLESRFLFTEDDFGSVRVFLSEGQRTRSADLIVRDGHLIWGMDAPEETSFLLSTSKEHPHSIRILRKLPGPAYYMARNEAGGVYVGTTSEPGAGVKDRFGHVFGSLPDQRWEEILRRRKDPFPQHGIFYFPRGIVPGNFLVYSQRALVPQEGRMIVALDRAWAQRAPL